MEVGIRGVLWDRMGRGADLGDWVAEFLSVGDEIAPDADDLRARSEELLRRRSRHGRQSWWTGEVEVTEKQMGGSETSLTD